MRSVGSGSDWRAAILIAGLTLAACGSGSSRAAPGGDFVVASVSPRDGAVLADQPSVVYVSLSRPLDEESIRAGAIRVVDGDGRNVRGQTVVRSLTPARAEFTPASDLNRGERYTIVVGSDLRSSDGETLASDSASTFVIGTRPPLPPPVETPEPVGCELQPGRIVYYNENTGSGLIGHAVDVAARSPVEGESGWPSHRLHECRRWFLGNDASTAAPLPNGQSAAGLAAVSSDGIRVTLVEGSATWVRPQGGNAEWLADDSAVSYVVVEPNGKALTSWIVLLPIRWVDGRPQPQRDLEQKLVSGSATGLTNSAITRHSWSPTGDELVYQLSSTIRVWGFASGSSRDLASGKHPQWRKRSGGTLPEILFRDDARSGVFAIRADGSGETLVVADTSSRSFHFPMWSPLDDRVAVSAKNSSGVSESVSVLDPETARVTDIYFTMHHRLYGWR